MTNLNDLLPSDPSPDALLDVFTGWVESSGISLYSHQEESLLAVLAGDNVIVTTPTGSGKSLIALGAHFAALAEDRRTWYTAPIKALVNEKFFALCEAFGAERVGMVTGDASVNADAPIVCCTAEILANLALREGRDADVGQVVMDEFHFLAEPERGWAWQVPLVELPQAQFVIMSATLGDVTELAGDLTRRTGRETAVIGGATRPVPLTYRWSLAPLHETIAEIVETHQAPVYIVHPTQGAAVEQAMALLSQGVVRKAGAAVPEELKQAITGFPFAGGFGATLSKLLRGGIGVHHAGMLPRYRRLVEQLAQRGLLAVICGTDTLGVGINVPIRTVLFSSLTKFDGRRQRVLRSREFHQIAGRAGRAGFDSIGNVVAQAPEHEVENARILAKHQGDEKKLRSVRRKKPPEGFVNYTQATFTKLIDSSPEQLHARMRISHALLLNLLQRDEETSAAVIRLIDSTDPEPKARRAMLRRAAGLGRSLLRAGVITRLPEPTPGGRRYRLNVDLQRDFALNQPLSAFALAVVETLDPGSPDYALDVVSVIEATLEDPRVVLLAQQFRARGQAVAEMKADGWDYEERMEALEEITWPQPLGELLTPALETYKQANPWIAEYELSPKSVVRDMVENAMTFSDLISRYELGRSEGVVLRYLTDAYRALRQVVPEEHRTSEVDELIDWLGALVRAVDSSLLDEWEALGAAQSGRTEEAADLMAGNRLEADDSMGSGGPAGVERAFGADADGGVAFTRNLHAFRVAVRRDMFRRVELMARDDVEGLGRLDGSSGWGEARWDDVLARYWDEHDWIGTDTAARAVALAPLDEAPDDIALAAAGVSERLREALEASGRRVWLATQVLDDPDGDHDWRLTALVDLAECDRENEAVVHMLSAGPQG